MWSTLQQEKSSLLDVVFAEMLTRFKCMFRLLLFYVIFKVKFLCECV